MVQTYILRFDQPLKEPVKSNFGDRYHYFGQSHDAFWRFKQHIEGRGSLITKRALREKRQIKLQCFFDGNLEHQFLKFKFQLYCTCELCRRIQQWGFGSGGDYVI